MKEIPVACYWDVMSPGGGNVYMKFSLYIPEERLPIHQLRPVGVVDVLRLGPPESYIGQEEYVRR
jgi:hypothetical protein